MTADRRPSNPAVGISSVWQELEVVLTPMLTGFRSGRALRVKRKADSTLLSEADEAAQAEIIRVLPRAADTWSSVAMSRRQATLPSPTGLSAWDIDPGPMREVVLSAPESHVNDGFDRLSTGPRCTPVTRASEPPTGALQ
jgi:hypothetical protein